MDTYRTAIIGYGRMAHGHAKAYQEVGLPLVAVADISEEALARFRDQFGQRQMYTDYRQMLDEVHPDIISVVTHDQLHCPMVVDAAERGVKGIVCEKPMAMTLKEADRMLTACRLSGTQLTISHQRYYTPLKRGNSSHRARSALYVQQKPIFCRVAFTPMVHTQFTCYCRY